MDWQTPPPDFRAVEFQRVNPARNEARYYYLAWQPTLFGENVVVRAWGHKGGQRRHLVRPFASLEDAWPVIRHLIRRRLKRGYSLITPATYQVKDE